MSQTGKHIELGGTTRELEEAGSRFLLAWRTRHSGGRSRDTHVGRGSILCGSIYGDWFVELEGTTVLKEVGARQSSRHEILSDSTESATHNL
jgi:hypothetical protein